MSIVLSDLSERLDTLTKLVLAEPVARIGHSRHRAAAHPARQGLLPA